MVRSLDVLVELFRKLTKCLKAMLNALLNEILHNPNGMT